MAKRKGRPKGTPGKGTGVSVDKLKVSNAAAARRSGMGAGGFKESKTKGKGSIRGGTSKSSRANKADRSPADLKARLIKRLKSGSSAGARSLANQVRAARTGGSGG